MFTQIEARGTNRDSLYGKQWEKCEGTDNLSIDDFNELVRTWSADEHNDYGHVVTDYRFMESVDGFSWVVVAKVSGN